MVIYYQRISIDLSESGNILEIAQFFRHIGIIEYFVSSNHCFIKRYIRIGLRRQNGELLRGVAQW